MKKLKGKMTVELTLEEVNTINKLIDRNETKAVRKDEKYNLTYCPVCGEVILSGYVFCAHCGQRIDTENYAF